jgi:hypothetical protein
MRPLAARGVVGFLPCGCGGVLSARCRLEPLGHAWLVGDLEERRLARSFGHMLASKPGSEMSTAHIFYPAPRAYYEWLGRFVEAFAGVEAALFNLLQSYAGLPDGAAQALFSGTRGKDAISAINRLCEIKPITVDNATELKDVFAQFRAIDDIRNLLIHHGTVAEVMFKRSDERKTTNKIRAHMARSVKEYQINTDMLRGLTDDLVKIAEHLYTHATFSDETFTERASWHSILAASWRYKRAGQ